MDQLYASHNELIFITAGLKIGYYFYFTHYFIRQNEHIDLFQQRETNGQIKRTSLKALPCKQYNDNFNMLLSIQRFRRPEMFHLWWTKFGFDGESWMPSNSQSYVRQEVYWQWNHDQFNSFIHFLYAWNFLEVLLHVAWKSMKPKCMVL